MQQDRLLELAILSIETQSHGNWM